MRSVRPAAALAFVTLAAACVENTAPGNDREAALDAPEPPAELVAAGAALSGVSTGLLKPEIMTDADLGVLSDLAASCRFRMTEVGRPVLLYGPSAVVKLNGKLVRLPPSSGEGHYGAEGLDVAVRPLEPTASERGRFEAELVLRLSGAEDELGFHGFAECDA